jgi:hypothetical protein
MTMVSEMISPALDADVMVSPNVSRAKMMLRIAPNSPPSTISERLMRRSLVPSTTMSPIAARANLMTRNANAVSVVAISLAAR